MSVDVGDLDAPRVWLTVGSAEFEGERLPVRVADGSGMSVDVGDLDAPPVWLTVGSGELVGE
jgi:hypothetical protein